MSPISPIISISTERAHDDSTKSPAPPFERLAGILLVAMGAFVSLAHFIERFVLEVEHLSPIAAFRKSEFFYGIMQLICRSIATSDWNET